MAGKIYTGVNNKAVNPRSIYVGSNNIARKVSAAYIGDSNNIARKVWPLSFLPNGYRQFKYIQLGGLGSGSIDISDEFNTDRFPRIIINFSVAELFEASYSYSAASVNLIHANYETDQEFPSYDPDLYYPKTIIYSFAVTNRNRFSFEFDNDIAGESADIDWSSNATEGLLLNTTYTLDFLNGTDIYLYNTVGYYSVASHNKIVSSVNKQIGKAKIESSSFDLFGTGDISKKGLVNIFDVKIYSGTTLIGDFYPAQRVSDSSYGFYEMINRIFYKHAGAAPGPEI